jgi:hypothetical protein
MNQYSKKPIGRPVVTSTMSAAELDEVKAFIERMKTVGLITIKPGLSDAQIDLVQRSRPIEEQEP